MRLLVCDDDVVVRMQLGIALEGVEVHEAHRGGEVTDLARKVHPDAVVVDIRLPDGDGLEVVRELRATPETASVVILVLTAGHDPAKRESVLGAGADEYMAKPFDPAQLETLLRRLLALPPLERKVRRTLQRARLHAGRDDGGTIDLPADPTVPVEVEPKGRRRRRRRREG
jgi:DNA-binding response OmpR family regulator